MDTLEKLSLAVVALSRRVEHIEHQQPTQTKADPDVIAARAIAEKLNLLDALKRSDNYHLGTANHRNLAKALRSTGWSLKRIAALWGVSEVTVRRWLK